MLGNQKNKNKQLKSELEITRAELEHYKRNPESNPTFVLSKNNGFGLSEGLNQKGRNLIIKKYNHV